MKAIQIAGTWRENGWLTKKKILRKDADAELKKLCAKFLPGKTQKQEVCHV